MSTLLGDARIRLRADTSLFESDAKSGIGSKLAGLGKAAAVAFAGGAVAAGGFGLKVAADLEQASIGFETMLGSGAKAQAFLKDLQGFAAKTPFEFPELQSAASKLVAVGTDASRVIPIMTVLGDSTAAMGTGAEGIDRAVMALQQMRVKGKVTGEEMLQLAEAGVPAWEALAAQLGVTTAEAQDMVSKGKVSVDDLFTAIETRQGETLTRTANMMDKQSQSLAGLWSTVKDTVQMSLAGMVEPLIPSIKSGLDKVAPMLESTLGGIGDSVKVLLTGDFEGGMFGGAFQEDSKYVDLLFRIREGFVWVRDTAKVLLTGDFKAGMFGGALEEDSKYIDVLFDIRETLAGFWGSLKGSFGNMLTVIQQLGPLLSLALGGGLALVLNGLSLIGPLLEDVTGFLADNVEIVKILVGAYAAYRLGAMLAAGATAALNAVMNMSPIAKVVTLLGALVAGVVWAWNNVDWFRDAVITAWDWIKNAATTAWESVLKPVFNALAQAWQVLSAGFAFAWTNVLQPMWNTFSSVVSTLWTSVLSPIFGLIGSVFMATLQLMGWAWTNILSPVFSAIGSVVGALWNGILSPIFSAVGAAWSGLATGMGWVWTNLIKPIFDAFGAVIGVIKDSFSTGVEFIKGVWDTLKDALMSPVQWVIDFVWNNGLRALWNVINNIWGGDDLPEFKLASGGVIPQPAKNNYGSQPTSGAWATGGVLPGYTPGRDVHTFTSPTGGKLLLSGGEAVMRPEFTRAISKAGVDELNRLARTGGAQAIRDRLAPQQALEKGGVIDLPGWLDTALDWIPGLGWVGDFIDKLNNNPAVQIVGGMIKTIAGKIWDAISSLWSGNEADGTVPVGQAIPVPTGGGVVGGTWGSIWNVVKAAIPQARINSGYRPGDPGYHGKNKAVDLGFGTGPGGPGNAGLASIKRFLHDGFGSSLAELIYNGIGNDRTNLKNGKPLAYSASTQAQHRNHVHAAVFDSGGVLPTGLTLAENRSGKPEGVLTAEQLEWLRGAAKGDRPLVGELTLHVGDGEVKDGLDEALFWLRRIRNGGMLDARA